jgi:hypothetical protein
VMTSAIWTWAFVIHARDAWRRIAVRGVRRLSRRVYRLAYESSQDLRKRTRRAHKRLKAGVRGAGVVLKRAARRGV